jgi:hypothetical protein
LHFLANWFALGEYAHQSKDTVSMITQIAIAPLVALIAGILILIAPRLLNYVVALYLIIIGVLGLFPNLLN